MRILVYGFSPYKEFKSNITQKIIRKLPRSANLKKIVFPVRFDKAQFIGAIEKHRPDVILGLGQCGSGKYLRIERRAVNRRRNGKEEKGRAIRRGGPRSLAPTLRLTTRGFGAITSSNAGDYVCNFSMYIILDYLRRRRRKARFGFVHIPHDYDLNRAERFVRKLIEAIASES
ncbi:MAG TPA: hypothetical protein VGH50_10875 [Candidatus Binatia bacterium]|jgi:pyroglutamyl-peptidase